MADDGPIFDENALTTYKGAARYLSITPRTAEDIKSRGEIAFVRVGRQVRFTRAALDDYIARQTRPAASA